MRICRGWTSISFKILLISDTDEGMSCTSNMVDFSPPCPDFPRPVPPEGDVPMPPVLVVMLLDKLVPPVVVPVVLPLPAPRLVIWPNWNPLNPFLSTTV